MRILLETPSDGAAVLHIHGRLDLTAASDVKSAILRAVDNGRPQVVVDLKDVPFIDSSGLGALIGGLRAARTAGGDLRIANPGPQARMILELTTLDRVLVTHETVEAALAAD
ncbi:MAG: STAS domain-containing protein [Dehalococcoidia bacterium]|nr:STAS domain-containing protein [Dehalococcoidia bacterium]